MARCPRLWVTAAALVFSGAGFVSGARLLVGARVAGDPQLLQNFFEQEEWPSASNKEAWTNACSVVVRGVGLVGRGWDGARALRGIASEAAVGFCAGAWRRRGVDTLNATGLLKLWLGSITAQEISPASIESYLGASTKYFLYTGGPAAAGKTKGGPVLINSAMAANAELNTLKFILRADNEYMRHLFAQTTSLKQAVQHFFIKAGATFASNGRVIRNDAIELLQTVADKNYESIFMFVVATKKTVTCNANLRRGRDVASPVRKYDASIRGIRRVLAFLADKSKQVWVHPTEVIGVCGTADALTDPEKQCRGAEVERKARKPVFIGAQQLLEYVSNMNEGDVLQLPMWKDAPGSEIVESECPRRHVRRTPLLADSPSFSQRSPLIGF